MDKWKALLVESATNAEVTIRYINVVLFFSVCIDLFIFSDRSEHFLLTIQCSMHIDAFLRVSTSSSHGHRLPLFCSDEAKRRRTLEMSTYRPDTVKNEIYIYLYPPTDRPHAPPSSFPPHVPPIYDTVELS